MADGFGGVTFVPLRDGGYRPLPSRTAAVVVRHIPGGNVTYFDYGGRTAGDWRGMVEVASAAALDSLTALLGSSGVLTLNGTAYNAILLGISEVKLRPLGVKHHAVVQFAVAN